MVRPFERQSRRALIEVKRASSTEITPRLCEYAVVVVIIQINRMERTVAKHEREPFTFLSLLHGIKQE